MLTQIDLDEDYTLALEHVAKSNGKSRRAFAAEFMESALDRVPGLMDMIRQRKVKGLVLDADIEIPEQKSVLLKEPPVHEEIFTFRFSYLDPSRGFVEGRGPTPGKAFMDAMGLDKFYDPDEYIKEFRPPERM